jgi:hypothetical protein
MKKRVVGSEHWYQMQLIASATWDGACAKVWCYAEDVEAGADNGQESTANAGTQTVGVTTEDGSSATVTQSASSSVPTTGDVDADGETVSTGDTTDPSKTSGDAKSDAFAERGSTLPLMGAMQEPRHACTVLCCHTRTPAAASVMIRPQYAQHTQHMYWSASQWQAEPAHR